MLLPIYLPVAGMAIDSLMLLAMCLSVRVLSGRFGICGGFVITPLLNFLGVPQLVAVGTGVSQVVAVSVSAAITQWRATSCAVTSPVFTIVTVYENA